MKLARRPSCERGAGGTLARKATPSLIEADEPPALEVVNPDGRGRALLVCDHASARMPRRLGTLGVRDADILRHVAWDIGAAAVARRLSELLDAPLLLSGYSRLVIDCNRPLDMEIRRSAPAARTWTCLATSLCRMPTRPRGRNLLLALSGRRACAG